MLQQIQEYQEIQTNNPVEPEFTENKLYCLFSSACVYKWKAGEIEICFPEFVLARPKTSWGISF